MVHQYHSIIVQQISADKFANNRFFVYITNTPNWAQSSNERTATLESNHH